MKTVLNFYQKNTLNLLLLGSSAVCVGLIFFRLIATGEPHFFFLIWNLILAWIPLLFSRMIVNANNNKAGNFKLACLFFLWLLFFPNAPYIITDLFHFHQRPLVPLWFDLVLILSFAWNGLMLGFISLMHIHDLLSERFNSFKSLIMVFALLVLCGFGIYLGRYKRWNSWDMFTNPYQLITDIGDRLIHPMDHLRTVGMTVLFSIFLIVNYMILYFLVGERKKIKE